MSEMTELPASPDLKPAKYSIVEPIKPAYSKKNDRKTTATNYA